MIPRLLGIGVAALALSASYRSAHACDELAGKLLSAYLAPAIASLGCSALARGGVDVANHKLESVCYNSAGPTSTVEVNASLQCRTSDAAFIKFQTSDHVKAIATVRGADCRVMDVRIIPSGEVGKVLVRGFGVEGRARAALQEGLTKICGH